MCWLLLSADPGQKELQKEVPVRVSSNGRVEWSVETLTTTVCDADPFYFPADTMECHVCFSATTALEQTIHCKGGRRAEEKGSRPCNSYSIPATEGEWYRKDMTFAKDNIEACFAIHLARIPLFHIATTVGPCIILVVLMIITFIMPLDRGDRISFGVTILLSMVVSLVFVTDVLPVKGALPFFATLIIVCMGLMGVFLFSTMGIIVVHDKEGSLSPLAKIIFLRYISKMLLLGDLTKEKRTGDEEDGITDHPTIQLTNYAFQGDDKTVVNDEKPGDGKGTSGQPTVHTADQENAGSSGLSELISGVKEVKTGIKELTNAINNETEELTKAMKNEEEVSDYTLLAKVLDRLSLVMYILSIAASVPMTMYLAK
ncbi:5-hydroxytryptamine receptor 3A-like [Branchiostoma lanceolatum]|uniref:5-hydroxytryptamine receptor 3A-like n=1 Tax=Branchiostoma lanceolatum TaxID=7740 RepID=UPI003454225D